MRVCEGKYGENEGEKEYVSPYFYTDDQEVEQEKPTTKKPIDYIVRAKVSTKLAGIAAELDDKHWHSAEIDISRKRKMQSEYAEVEYKAASWKEGRRIILVRRLKKEEDSSGLQPKLFAADERLRRYTLMAFVTSLEMSCKEVHRHLQWKSGL